METFPIEDSQDPLPTWVLYLGTPCPSVAVSSYISPAPHVLGSVKATLPRVS